MDLAQLTKLTEDQARDFIETIRWPNGPICPHCGGTKIGSVAHNQGKKIRAGLYTCLSCIKQFTVTVDTVMQDSHIPLRQWLIAFHLMTSSKKGVSALQLQRNLGLGSYKSAWHLAHRIRHAMTEGTLCAPLKGIVEVDETYIGGKPRGGAEPGKSGRGTKKTAVVALVERNGRVRSKPIERVTAKTLKGAIRANVHPKSRIMTDEFAAYGKIGTFFKSHEVVKHSEKEYSRGDVTTNTVESYFALLKRGVHGIFHHVSKEHLHRYCDEFSFRWNHRKIDDGERTIEAIIGTAGKRLSYKPIVNGARLN
ncbi:MAG: IS1595 family transposase [Desulfomonilaceae bacterium]